MCRNTVANGLLTHTPAPPRGQHKEALYYFINVLLSPSGSSQTEESILRDTVNHLLKFSAAPKLPGDRVLPSAHQLFQTQEAAIAQLGRVWRQNSEAKAGSRSTLNPFSEPLRFWERGLGQFAQLT